MTQVGELFFFAGWPNRGIRGDNKSVPGSPKEAELAL